MIYKESFKLESRHRAVSFHDVTDKVKEIFAASKMKDGIVVVYSHHTCRYEGQYLHPGPKALVFAEEHGEDNFGCHNTDAHLRSSVIGRNVTIVAVDGEMDLGEFGRIHFIDWDQTRGRTRTVQVMIIGE